MDANGLTCARVLGWERVKIHNTSTTYKSQACFDSHDRHIFGLSKVNTNYSDSRDPNQLGFQLSGVSFA